MVEINTYPTMGTKEQKRTVATLCMWVLVLTLSCSFIIDKLPAYDFESVFTYLVMWPTVIVGVLISIYKIGRAILNLYKHR